MCWYPFQSYSPRQPLQYPLHYYVAAVVVVPVVVVVVVPVVLLVVVAVVVVPVVVVLLLVVAAVVVVVVVPVVWQFCKNQGCRWSDCQSSVVGYSASLAAAF